MFSKTQIAKIKLYFSPHLLNFFLYFLALQICTVITLLCSFYIELLGFFIKNTISIILNCEFCFNLHPTKTVASIIFKTLRLISHFIVLYVISSNITEPVHSLFYFKKKKIIINVLLSFHQFDYYLHFSS